MKESSKPTTNERCFSPNDIYRAVERAGATPSTSSPLSSAAAIRRSFDSLDGLLISGGGFDIHPSHYGERPIRQLGVVKAQRTEFELDIAAGGAKKRFANPRAAASKRSMSCWADRFIKTSSRSYPLPANINRATRKARAGISKYS